MRIAALAAGALAVHVLLGVVVLNHPGALGVDTAAFDVLHPLVGAGGQRVVRVLTDIGSFPVVAVVAVVAAILAARAGRGREALLLALGVLAIVLLDGIAKGVWDRPRPGDRFYEPGGASYPSGHSAQSIVWVASARVLRRGPLVVAAVALAVAIGLSRLYLHVHYLTDVLGGFALGVAVLSPVLASTSR